MKTELFVLKAVRNVNFEIKLTGNKIYKVFDVKTINKVTHFLIYDDTNHFVYAHNRYFKPVD